MTRKRGVTSSVPYKYLCKRCGNYHSANMTRSYLDPEDNKRYYVATQIENPIPYVWRRDAELDQCDHWAQQLEEQLGAPSGSH